MLLSNLIQVTESISGSVVPMAMFFFAGLGLLRANWACSIRDLRDISCARRTCTEWLKGGDLDSSSLKAGLSISLEISSYAARAFLTERMRTTRPIDIAQYTTLAPCPSQQWRGPTDPEQGASTVISTAATHLPSHPTISTPDPANNFERGHISLSDRDCKTAKRLAEIGFNFIAYSSSRSILLKYYPVLLNEKERDPQAEKLIPVILVIWKWFQPRPRAIFAEKLDQFSLVKGLAFHVQMMAL